MDVLFVNPNSAKQVYQGLSERFSAIEVPVWSLLLASACHAQGFGVAIMDCDAERLTDEQALKQIAEANPRLVCFVVYGQNPNSGTTNMTGAMSLCRALRLEQPERRTCFVGSHTSALPMEVLSEPCVDFVLIGEGVYGLIGLLTTNLRDYVANVKGIGYKQHDGTPCLTGAQKVVPQDRMDLDLPGYAWDLLAKKEKPLDLYRSHFWHADFQDHLRTPAAAIYTSLGCQFKCLSGDTPVNTISGFIPLRDLVGKRVLVYTFNRETGYPEIAEAVNIRKTGDAERLIRVNFRDGSHIDCTPDHRFLRFKWGNQNVGTREWETEAAKLKPGDRVRAISFSVLLGYNQVSCGRRKTRRNCRLVMEHMIGRPMKRPESVHHINRVKNDDRPENLLFCASQAEHLAHHPEVADRMRCDNPSKFCTEESYRKISLVLTGLKRSAEQRLRYHQAATIREASMSAEKKAERAAKMNATKLKRGIIKRIVNHVVASVESLPGTHETYCLEVPQTGWFFANNVLVHNCDFCMINLVNRTDPADGITAADSSGMRFWSPEHVVRQIDQLYQKGVRTIRLSDEMFFLNRRYFEPLLKMIVERGYGKDLRMWAYARVDTVRPRYLDLFRQAGIRWLALGIESADTAIRREVTKGTYEETDVRQVVKQIRDAGVNVIANYLFGLPDDTFKTMHETTALACELNTEMANMYPTMALPGSPLYYQAKTNGWQLPDSFEGYSFLSYDCQPLPTKYLTAAEVLKFRDEAWQYYFRRTEYLDMIQRTFGQVARENIQTMASVPLKRRLLVAEGQGKH